MPSNSYVISQRRRSHPVRRVLNPTVALITFFVGISTAAIRLNNPTRQSYAPAIESFVMSAAPAAAQSNPETEKYAVYSALIKDMYVNEGVKLLVIETTHECAKSSEANKVSGEKAEQERREEESAEVKRFPGLERETIHDFLIRADECQPLSRQFDLPVSYVLVTDKEVERFFRKDGVGGWKRFYEEYPNSSGIISFSNVGFNPEMTQAYVTTSNGCGGLCGAGYDVFLTKKEGVWKVTSKNMTWVS